MVAIYQDMADTVTMPGLQMPRPHDPERIVNHTRAMQQRYRKRDGRWDDVRALRRGELEDTPFQEYLSEMFEKPIIANTIDTCARDLAEMLAPLPSFNCTSASMRSDADRRRADLRTKIAGHYVNHSNLAKQQLYACDHYFTHAMAVYYVEPDREAKLPRIVNEDPYGGYPEWDRWYRLKSYTKRWFIEGSILADLYPEHADKLYKEKKDFAGNSYEVQVELIRYWDKDGCTLVLATKRPAVLDYKKNVLSKLPVVIIRKPWLDPFWDKGQFDDVLFVQMAKDGLAKLQYEAVNKAVQSPLAVPNDVQELAYGGDALLRSATPDKIRRVGMEMSNMSFIENQSLGQELLDGSRYPAARATGNMEASIITGRGVQALMGGLESQIKAGQTVLREGLIDIIGLCFQMDEKLWPNFKKEIRGHIDGTPYSVTYTPAIDVAGQYDVDCEYGFAAGLDPNRAAVLLLQMRADNVISRDYMARQQPFSLNVSEEQSKILQENLREAIMQGIYAYAQTAPQMAQAGMDPGNALRQLAVISKGLQKGKAVEDVVAAAFAPPPEPEAPEDQLTPGEPGMGEPQMGQEPMAPGTAPTPAGAKPDLSIALAGLTSAGRPQMSNTISRRRAV